VPDEAATCPACAEPLKQAGIVVRPSPTLLRETKGEVVSVSRLRSALEKRNAVPPEAITAAENHDPRLDRWLMVFPENVAQPKTVNQPEVRQHNSNHRQKDNVRANHGFPTFIRSYATKHRKA
jgi:hypothetical protein